MATKQNSSGLPPAATDGEGAEPPQGTAGKPAREAPPPPATRNAEAYFREALVEVPAFMRAYAKAGPDPGKLVAFTLGQHRAVRLALCQLWAEARTSEHVAETRRRDATAQDEATQALLAELEGRIAALEAKVAALEGRGAR